MELNIRQIRNFNLVGKINITMLIKSVFLWGGGNPTKPDHYLILYKTHITDKDLNVKHEN